MSERFPQPVNDLRSRPLPEPGYPAGYAALIDRYELQLPLPPRLAATATRHHSRSTDDWLMLTPRHRPDDTLEGHLTFALKWEGVDLSVLAALFQQLPEHELVNVVRDKPTGSFARRIWFLYEWLTERELDVPNPGKVKAVPVVNPAHQIALDRGTPSSRHKVIDNLPGSRLFCPMVRRTRQLETMLAMRLDSRARTVVGRTRGDLLARAAAFLLLNDSKSSFAIEDEQPSAARATRWGQAIAQAGSRKLNAEEFARLQRIVIGDARFVRLGLRNEGGFVGTHDRKTGEPVPDHVSARHEDLPSLIDGISAYGERALGGGADPVVAAAVMAFGFIYVHPFVDGNGRLHRWIIHHVLSAAGYNPPGVIFPISAAIMRRLDEYHLVLESYSSPLLPYIDWRASASGNVEVLNETRDFYRYFDATRHAEFLYSCVERTVAEDLPNEVRFLEAFDRFSVGVQRIVDMPSRQVELLRSFLEQGKGRLSGRARSREFAALTDAEAREIERLYAVSFVEASPGSQLNSPDNSGAAETSTAVR